MYVHMLRHSCHLDTRRQCLRCKSHARLSLENLERIVGSEYTQAGITHATCPLSNPHVSSCCLPNYQFVCITESGHLWMQVPTTLELLQVLDICRSVACGLSGRGSPMSSLHAMSQCHISESIYRAQSASTETVCRARSHSVCSTTIRSVSVIPQTQWTESHGHGRIAIQSCLSFSLIFVICVTPSSD